MMLIEKIILNMDREVAYELNKQYSYQSILFDCAQQLANYTIGTRKHIQLNVSTTKIRRTDLLEVPEKILTLSPDERKGLGINRSTLWYQQKKLAGGKQVNAYSKIMSKLAA